MSAAPSFTKSCGVISREGINARHLTREDLPQAVGVAVVDVSFISLRQVLPSLVPYLAPGAVLVALVKPQFEVGRERVAKGGVVKDAAARTGSIEGIARFVGELGLDVRGAVDSPISGPAGNVEALLVACVPPS